MSFEPTVIPKEFLNNLPQSTRFCKIKHGEKGPFENGWDINGYTYEQIKPWLDMGGNYGVIAAKPLMQVETDDPIYETGLPKTLTVRSGGGNGLHRYYIFGDDIEENGQISDGELGHIQIHNKCVVGPGSTHPNGNKYSLVNHGPIANISKKQLEHRFGKLLRWTNKKEREQLAQVQADSLGIKITDVYSTSNLQRQGDEYCGAHPVHGSQNENPHNFWMNPTKNVWHCFRCESGGGPLELIALLNHKLECKKCVPGALRGKLYGEIIDLAVEKYNAKRPKLEKLSDIKPDLDFWPTIPDPIECDDTTLNADIDEFLKEHIELATEEEYLILRYFIQLTWIAETLYTTPYLHFLGPHGSGKTRALDIIQNLGYKAILAATLSPAVIYHAIETYHPTLLCDESDTFTKKGKNEHQDDVQYILNSGYRRGLKALRMKEQDGQKVLAGYDVFGPKCIAGTEPLRDTTEDRCLIFTMNRNVSKKPVIMNFPKAREIRGKLHAWRQRQLPLYPQFVSFASFDTYTTTGSYQLSLSTTFKDIDNRTTELLLPMCILGTKDTKDTSLFETYVKRISAERLAEERSGYDAEITKIIRELDVDEKNLFTSRQVADVFNTGRPEKARWSTDSIGRLVKRLGFKKDRNTKGNPAWIRDEGRLKALCDRYGIKLELNTPGETPNKPQNEPAKPTNMLRRLAPSDSTPPCGGCGQCAAEFELSLTGAKELRCQSCVDGLKASGLKFDES